MGRYSQEDRAFRVSVPSLGEDVLLLEGFSGQEHVSEPFEFTLEMVSENDSIAPAEVLREPFIVSIRLPDGSDRQIHGLCRRFAQLGKDEGLTSYQAEIVPWLWFLSLNQDCRIFQAMTVPEVIEEIIGKYPQADFENKCVESYSLREYCVQYRESDLNFVSRLMEEEGIYYFFEHSDEGHKLILADDGSALEDCPGQSTFRVATSPEAWLEEDVITWLEREHEVYTNTVTLTDYDPLQPSMDLESTASDEDYEELYDYPGKYTKLSDGERYARLLLEERAAGREVVRGEGTGRAMRSGYTFDLEDHYRADTNQSYFILSLWHLGRGGGYRAGEGETEYSNRLECIPASLPYRPPRRATKPVMRGAQTAVVVGPSGEEIYTEKNGQVKVQFHWDRLGQRDENSSCWIRVSHPWAGKGWGAVSIPRIGQEVIVDFLEGDPDRPIITGRVYNAEVMPPFPLPAGAVVSGTKSQTHKGSGANEISMNDTAGQELLNVNAQYDMTTNVGNDDTHSVTNNRTASVGVDETCSVGSNQSISVGADQSLEVGANQNVTVGADQTVEVGGTQNLTVGAAQNVDVGAAQAVTVAADSTLEAGANIELTSGADFSLSAAANVSSDSGADTNLTAGANFALTAGANADITGGAAVSVTGASITLSGGGSSISIGPGGIQIVAGGMVTIMGALVKIN